MRGMLRFMRVAGMVGTRFAGYRPLSIKRTPRNPAGLEEANLAPEQRREAAKRFRLLRRRRSGSDTK